MSQQNSNISGNRNPKLSSFSVIISFVALAIIGISLVPLLDIQLKPSRNLPSLSVQYSWSDASAEIIEREVTSILEGVLNSIRGVKNINSVSNKNSGNIDIEFKDNINLDAVRFEISTLIRQIYPELPEQVSFPTISYNSGREIVEPVMTYTLNSGASPFHIKDYADNHIVNHIARIKGVNGVNVYGATPFEWEICFSSDKIFELGINANNISSAINRYFGREIIGTGALKSHNKESLKELQVVVKTDTPNEINWNNIPISNIGGRIIKLGDIAKTRYKSQPPNKYHRINGLNTINLVIYPEEDINTIRLAESIKEEIELVKKNLPKGYSLILAHDTTEFLSDELNKIALRTIFSMVILLVFVFVLSRQFRYLLLIFFSLIANLIIAVVFYYFFNVEIHLYSLAGITISFGIIIDNSIVMIDHIRHTGRKDIFIAILAATLTTIGSLSVIFFLKENQQINLIDFALVIIINLSVSIAVALFFIPALMDKIGLQERRNRRFFKRKRRVIKISNFYTRSILLSKKFKWLLIPMFVLGFGLPIHWLPTEIEGDGFWEKTYNKTIGSSWYNDGAREVAEKIVGGSLRLFTENVFESSFYSAPERTILNVRGTMPEGCTVQQLNEAIKKMENYISKFEEVEMFKTSIYSYNNSRITIYFKPDYEFSSFPYFLKEDLTSKAINLGGLDWGIFGVGRGFSNALHSGYKNGRIVLEGYNYNELYKYAEELSQKLSKNQRVKDIEIRGSDRYRARPIHEYNLELDNEQLALNEVSLGQFYEFLNNKVYRQPLKTVFIKGQAQKISLVSDKADVFNVWDLNNVPIEIEKKTFKMDMLGNIVKRKSGNNIYKYNQQYRLNVFYDFIGPGPLAERVRDKHIEEINTILPMGYKARKATYRWWNKKDKNQYYLLLLVIGIIYFICSFLLESLLQPLAIIAMIPISFIGVFLTFYFFDFNFDQGGFASFILLAGIVVNAGLYIINDYNHYRRDRHKRTNLTTYIKAYNHKVIPTFLTIVSTIIGLIPFVWGGQNEAFWFAFAVGTMGGLLFSFIALVVYLPLFMRLKI